MKRPVLENGEERWLSIAAGGPRCQPACAARCALAEWELSQLSEYTAPVREAIEENTAGCGKYRRSDTFISLAAGVPRSE